MSAKTISIIAYITIFGWIIAYLQNKSSDKKSELASYHLGQGLGIFIFSVVLNIALIIIVNIVPSLATVLSLLSLIPLILLIFGVITANNEAMKPVPVIGKFFEGKFNF